MKTLHLNNTGLLTFADETKTYITASPLGLLVMEGCAYAPVSAEIDGENITLQFEPGSCKLTLQNCGKYYKITGKEVPAGTERFIFGPYATEATSFGEIIGAGWYDDGSVVCIQSLMPKVISGFDGPILENKTGLDLGMGINAASEYNEKIYLHHVQHFWFLFRYEPMDKWNHYAVCCAKKRTLSWRCIHGKSNHL